MLTRFLNFMTKMFSPKVPSYGDVITLNEKGQLLILLRTNNDDSKPGEWCLPGGHLEVGELSLPIEGARRELEEETNIYATSSELQFYKKLTKEDAIIYYYLLSVHSSTVKIILDADEHQGYQWIYPHQIRFYNFQYDLGSFLMECFNVAHEVELIDEEMTTFHDVEHLDINFRIEKAEKALAEALDGGLDEDVYLEKYQQLQIIKANYNSNLVERINNAGQLFKVKIRTNPIEKADDVSSLEISLSEDYEKYLNNCFYFKNRIYDDKGIGLPLTSEQVNTMLAADMGITPINIAMLEGKFASKKGIFEETKRYEFMQILPIITRYNELYDKYEKELRDTYNSMQSNFKSRRNEMKRNIADFLADRDITVAEFLFILEYIQDNLNKNLDPLLIVTFEKGDEKKVNQVYISELVNYLLGQEPKERMAVRKITIVDLDSFGDMEFKMTWFDSNNTLVIQAVHQKVIERLYTKAKLEKGEENKPIGKAKLKEFAKNSSLIDLESTIKESNDPVLRAEAHKEIKRREEEEHIKEKREEIKKGENSTAVIDKGCLMLYPEIDKEKWNEAIRNLIPEDVVVEYEDDPHITILYGFDDAELNVEELETVVSEFVDQNPILFDLDSISLFCNENDVVKIGITDLNGNLHRLNELVRSHFKYENNFPDYKPHMTIAYVNKGAGDAISGLEINKAEFGMTSLATYSLLYSNARQEKRKIKNYNSATILTP